MGGVNAKRQDHLVKLLKEGSKELGKYGDPIKQRIYGMMTEDLSPLHRLNFNTVKNSDTLSLQWHQQDTKNLSNNKISIWHKYCSSLFRILIY